MLFLLSHIVIVFSIAGLLFSGCQKVKTPDLHVESEREIVARKIKELQMQDVGQSSVNDVALISQTVSISNSAKPITLESIKNSEPEFTYVMLCVPDVGFCGPDGLFRLKLPSGAHEITRKYWFGAVKFHFTNKFIWDKIEEKERSLLSDAHVAAMDRMYEELSSIEIETPTVPRRLSISEIGQITKQLNQFAQMLIESKAFTRPESVI